MKTKKIFLKSIVSIFFIALFFFIKTNFVFADPTSADMPDKLLPDTVVEPGWFPGNNFNPDEGGIDLGLSDVEVIVIIATIMRWLLIVAGLAGVIGCTVSGLMYIMSAGDEKKATSAKNALKWSVIGIAVSISGIIALSAVDNLLWGYEDF